MERGKNNDGSDGVFLQLVHFSFSPIYFRQNFNWASALHQVQFVKNNFIMSEERSFIVAESKTFRVFLVEKPTHDAGKHEE